MEAAQKLQDCLHAEIPLTHAMGVQVKQASTSEIRLAAPLAPNVNHQRTAFGGSIHSLAVLSGWSLLRETLREGQWQVDYVVIQDSSLHYLAPVRGDFEARCAWASTEHFEKFREALSSKGKARTELTAQVLCQGTVCAEFKGRFVAQVKVPS